MYQICKSPGHSADRCDIVMMKILPPNNNNAFYAFLDDVIANPEWLIDSGTTNHIISEPSNIIKRSEYFGDDKLIVNGQGLKIKHAD